MLLRSCDIATRFLLASAWTGLMLLLQHSDCLADTSCNPQGGITTIGLEWVADQCIPYEMNDATSIHYSTNMIQCSDPAVTLEAHYGDTLTSPAAIVNSLRSQGYKVFRNQEGSHIVAVHRFYSGEVGGKSMASYATGQVYTDVFDEAFVLPATIPDCSGGDFDDCGNERPSGSTVNVGTGRLSHSQDLFVLDNNRSLWLSVTLYYRSIPFAPSSIGNGWSHSYEMTLQPGSGSSMVFWNRGTRQIFSKLNDRFVPPRGAHSKLVQNSDSSWTVTEPNGIRYNFDSSGKVTSLVDRFSNYLTFSYTTGRLASVADSTGRSVTFGYHPTSGKLEKIIDPKQNAHILHYLDGNLAGVTPPGDKGVWRYGYANGLLQTKTDPESNLTRYFYYPDQRLKETTDPASRGRSYSYPSSTGSPGKVPDPYPVASLPRKEFVLEEKDKNSWSYLYDTRIGKLRSVTDPYKKTTTYYYNADATLRAKTEPFGEGGSVTTFYTYDSRGNLLTETDPVDLSGYTPPIDPQKVDIASLASLTPPIKTAVSYSYDPDHQDDIKIVTEHRASPPITTSYERYTEPDGSGGTLLVTQITSPGETAGSTLTSYWRQNGDGTVASITDAGNQTTSFTYYPINTTTIADGTSGMLLSIAMPDKVKLTCTAYDKNGNLTEFKLTGSDNKEIPVRSTQGYDALNMLTSILKASTQSPANFPPNLTQFRYDNNGNRSSVTDAETNTTTYKYTYQGQLNEIVDARLRSTKFEYGGSACPSCSGGVDQLTAVRDANHIASGNAGTVYTYDKAGRLETETDPVGKKFRYTYYDGGLLKQKIDATNPAMEKVLITYLYTNRGQLTDKLYADNTSVHFTYEGDRLKTASNMTGSTVTFSYTFAYHDNGRLKSVTDITNNRTIYYDEYFPNGQRKKVTYLLATSEQCIITYDYDANRPWHIYSPAGTFTFGYDERGRRNKLTYPNGTQADYGYDDLDRLTSVNHSVTGGSTFLANGYPEHDKVGNIKTRTGDFPASYLYDELYRLEEAHASFGSEKFTYDDVGNRQSGPGPRDTTYDHDAANRMTKGRQYSYTYDNNGNQTRRTTLNPDKNWSLTWDYQNRLTKMERVKGAEKRTVQFKYDPFGRRIEKSITMMIDGVNKTITTTYIYDEEDIAIEINSDGTSTATTRYIHGPGIDEPLALERGGLFYFYHQDGLGSVTAITSSGTTPVQTYTYTSFGATRPTSNFENGYQFTSREYDKETGLYYYRARYYDEIDGSFLSKDSFKFEVNNRANLDLETFEAAFGTALYLYVENNPVNHGDPLGFYSVRGGVAYDDNNLPIGEAGLDGPSFLLDPVNWIPVGMAIKGGKQCVLEGVKRGGWMNANRNFRLGFGRHEGRRVFRLSGNWVKRFKKSGHIDFWKGGRL